MLSASSYHHAIQRDLFPFTTQRLVQYHIRDTGCDQQRGTNIICRWLKATVAGTCGGKRQWGKGSPTPLEKHQQQTPRGGNRNWVARRGWEGRKREGRRLRRMKGERKNKGAAGNCKKYLEKEKRGWMRKVGQTTAMVVVHYHDNSCYILNAPLDPDRWLKLCQVSWGIKTNGITVNLHPDCELTVSSCFPTAGNSKQKQ